MVQEMRIALRNAGKINPNNLEDYLEAGGYQGLTLARSQEPLVLIEELERSGRLRGRGGAGFNTGLKWRSAAAVESETKYVICNADEGEPGTYKDRLIMEQDPHSILEGMLICAHAIAAKEAYIYCRGEYKKARETLAQAIRQATEKGLCNDVTIQLVSGAGSYVCGEETALIESMEGNRGEPRLKPPYPTVAGFRGKPTVVNNVETFATIPVIITKGAEWFKSVGMPAYPGTKIFCLSGDVKDRVYAEVPTDVTLQEIVFGLGGGVADGRTVKAVQVGGSSCAFLKGDSLDTTVDFESLSASGGALGSGSVLVIDDSHNMVDILAGIAHFFAHESCGKCAPCREGSQRLAELLDKLAAGQGKQADVEKILSLSELMQTSSFCPLGQSATVAVTSALRLFHADFDAKLQEEKKEEVCPHE